MTPKQFRKARLKLKLTQQEMADELGVLIRQVQRWEGDEQPIRRITELAVKYLLLINEAD